MIRTAPAPSATSDAPDLYRAFWRWHFYAGLLILPVLVMMAVTGGLYLFKPEIERALYRPMMNVEPRAAMTDPDGWIATAADALGGRVARVELSDRPDQAVRLVVETPAGQRTAFVDPYDGRLTGSIAELGVMQTVKRLHSLDIAGRIPNILIEVVAGWALVMIATGVFLWWPRGRSGGVMTVRGRPGARLFWRDLHAVTGFSAAAIIMFLAVTGMPWSAVWGDQVRKMTTAAGWGAPTPPAAAAAWSHGGHKPAAAEAVPWALQDTHLHMDHPPMRVGLTLSTALAAARSEGLPRPLAVAIPGDPGKAWSVSRTADRAEDLRTLYLASDDGRVLADIGYAAYGPAAKAIQWGIATHQGQEYGPANRWLMLAGCVAVVLLAVSSVVMWWKRRPSGRLGAPPRPASRRAYAGLAAVILPLAILYPLVGVSLAVVLLADLAITRLARVFRPTIGAA
ncbi:MAG: PepSY domain-containing protein [Phenylobacterium sp.]|nr:PepSY domain-containing protein [Phenylobacterium sp.]